MSLDSIILESVVLASAGVISIGSIMLVILLLISDKGLRNGLGYVIGYTLGYLLIGFVVIMTQQQLTTDESESNQTSVFSFILVIL